MHYYITFPSFHGQVNFKNNQVQINDNNGVEPVCFGYKSCSGRKRCGCKGNRRCSVNFWGKRINSAMTEIDFEKSLCFQHVELILSVRQIF